MRIALVKAIALPAVYRAKLEFQSHVPFQHSRTRVMRALSRIRAHARTPRVLHFSAFICYINNAFLTGMVNVGCTNR